MQKYSKKRQPTSTRRFHLRPIWPLSLLAFLFVVCGVFLTFASHSQASTSVSTQAQNTTSVVEMRRNFAVTTAPTQKNLSKKQQPAPIHAPVIATSPLPTSTPQHTQLGVFPLSAGGPLPVPESVLHPTNIARVMLGSTLVSVYAGSMTRNPQTGILCVLREDLTTGELHLQVYQGPQTGGALTILSIQNNVLKISNTKTQGTFNLTTNTFQW